MPWTFEGVYVKARRSAIGHFRVPPGLCIKTRLGAQPLIWKWFFILMQIKLICTRKVEHLTSLWYRGPGELGNGLFMASAQGGDIYGDECYSLDKTSRAISRARTSKKINFIFILIQKHGSVNSSSFSSFFCIQSFTTWCLRIMDGSFWAHFRQLVSA